MKITTRKLAVSAILLAADVLLTRVFAFNTPLMKIGLGFAAIALCAMLYGPAWAALVSALGDLIGSLAFPTGAYFPGFTLTCVITGAVYGLLLHKKQTPLRILIAIAIVQLGCGLLVNTYWISVLYGSPFTALLVTRSVQCLIMIPVEFIVIGAMSRLLARHKASLTA